MNNRKQKIIPSYELEIKLGWEGSTAAGATAKGKVGTAGQGVALGMIRCAGGPWCWEVRQGMPHVAANGKQWACQAVAQHPSPTP